MPDDDTAVVEPDSAPVVSVSRRRAPFRVIWEHALAVLLGLLVLAVHDVGYLLGQPFWTDEAWVAVTTRFPLSQLLATTSSTPIGWSALVRVVTVGGEQVSRLLPLAFAGVAVIIGYWFARRLDWQRRDVAVLAGVLCAAAVLLVPAMLIRDDLKQYTADAAFALLVVAMTSRLERNWSRWALAGLSCSAWCGMLFSHTAAFVGAAACLAVGVVQLVRREWRRFVEAVVAGLSTVALMAVIYLTFDARAVVPGLTSYWNAYYLPLNHGALTFVANHLHLVRTDLGLGPMWLAGSLFVIGVITLFRVGRPATAIAVVLIWPIMLAVSAVRKYPFLDVRTSTFLVVLTVAVAAVGVAGLCALVRPWLRGGLSFGLALVAVVAFGIQVLPSVRSHDIPNEDVRDQTAYVAAHAAPDDVILVNMNSNWGFAYYWPTGTPAHRPDPADDQGYEAYFPDQPRIVVATDRDDQAVSTALDDALARVHPGARVWLIRAHVFTPETTAWQEALSSHGLTAVPVGGHGLSVIQR